MIDTVLFYVHYGLTLLWGITLSAAFNGVKFTKKNIGILSIIFIICGTAQLSVLLLWGEQRIWELYPLLVHGLLSVFLVLTFRKRVVTVLSSVFLAYLCCQPSKWFGLLAQTFVENSTIVWCVHIAVSFTVVILVLRFFAKFISALFSSNTRSVLIAGSVPFVYYLFDYTVSIYTDLWKAHYRLVSEFLAFFLCAAFMVFCIVYYREYEKKTQTQRKNQIIEITVQQQAKEIETIRKSNMETNLLRHDMRLLLNNLALSIEQNDTETARSLISGYVAQVDAATPHRYCGNDTINYILTDFSNKCQKDGIALSTNITLDSLSADEIMFSSILSNAIDNALNAQKDLPTEEREICLILKNVDNKLLLSVKNPFRGPLALDPISNMPICSKKGHGSGTQSILHLTEKLGGKCQFSVQDQTFTLRVIL